MISTYNKYGPQYLDNQHIGLKQKLCFFDTIIPAIATMGSSTWTYEPKHLFKLQLTQVILLARLMRRRVRGFTITKAMTIASNHDWHQLVPITYHIHKQQILYLKHLFTSTSPSDSTTLQAGHPRIYNTAGRKNNIWRVNILSNDIADNKILRFTRDTRRMRV